LQDTTSPLTHGVLGQHNPWGLSAPKRKEITMSTIIEKATKGNRAAMNQLLEANKNEIYGLCLALLGSKPEATSGTVICGRASASMEARVMRVSVM